ncbi:ATP-dependent Clp protease ATP-binding subunit [Candidatus Saccharibacteria bacterium]|nr:ATP-dependent Clp protease ATP-binding subunit [Candidatus Saccharibacteria bacterium]
MVLDFHYNSVRAREARAGKILGKKPVLFLCFFLAIAFFSGGVALLIIKSAFAWICFSAGIFIAMIIYYTKKELIPVPARHGNTSTNPSTTAEVVGLADINDVLSNDVMANLPKNPKPLDLAKMVQHTNSGQFLAVRYGIGTKLLTELAKTLPEDTTPIFQTAVKIYQGTNSEEIHGAIIAVSIISNFPANENLLKQMKLEMADLLDGIIWFNYLNGLVKGVTKMVHSGGIARDMNFGYIPTLQRFGQNISNISKGHMKTQLHLAEHKDIVSQIVQIFSNDGRQNVALIGAEGSGRSTIIHAFAEQLMDADSKLPNNLKFRQIFKLDAAAILSAASERGQIEGLLMHIMDEAYNAKNIIIWLDNAQLFFEDGTGSIDISNVILPILEAGRLRMILTMDKQKFLEISARKSVLTNTLNKIMVPPANEEETMKVMQDQVPVLEFQHKVSYTIWALKEAYHLSERYVHDLEMPGRAVSLLDAAGDYALPNHLVTAESVQQAVEKTEGVKIQQAADTESRSKLLNMEELIHQRMIDQQEAVKTVSDALRRAAAGVRNENRPIGTFLFLGPTGVGKTELAKAVSEVYFDGEKNIIRLDLNEFVSPDDVARLIADGAEDEMSLTAQVMKQPFSVVLLDEIEKAHPQVLTTLLQLLDEGILRDAKGREVSFRDTIVVATSNAGAEKIREQVMSGNSLSSYKEQFLNELMQSGEFKPEFLNRFDEICLFKPLSPTDCLQVLDLILKGVNKTLAPQKITIILDDNAKQLLVERGYDPQLGARPMKRIVQKSVENLVAKFLLSGSVGAGATINVTREMLESELGNVN